jgi:hypothetical protein
MERILLLATPAEIDIFLTYSNCRLYSHAYSTKEKHKIKKEMQKIVKKYDCYKGKKGEALTIVKNPLQRYRSMLLASTYVTVAPALATPASS